MRQQRAREEATYLDETRNGAAAPFQGYKHPMSFPASLLPSRAVLLALALVASLAACNDRPGGLPYLTRAQCAEDEGRVVPMGDAGADATCGSESFLVGRITPDDAAGEELGCCA